MNKIFLLLSTLFFISNATAQEYTPFFGESSTGWYQYLDAADLDGKMTLTFYTDGDSIVDGITYHKVYYDLAGETDSIEYQLDGLYREDIEEQKVYALNAETALEREKLVYDFSKSAGDTIRLGVNIELLLDSVSNTLHFCGQSMELESQVYYLKNSAIEDSTVIWIEGVGSLTSPFLQYSGVNCDSITEALLCKMTDEEIVYHFNEVEGFEDCPFEVSSSNESRPEPLELKLFPNPATSRIYISGDPNELGKSTFKVYSLTGQEIKRGVLDYSQQTEIDVTNLNSGAYMIEIFNKEKNLLSIKKFIIAQ
ncbi:T9SS type A sorting domain-containing protein [Membranihabitans maritimus]|uniref:T9SS type A sorting domain-containing protein n=1 Tax=Membranihabitans maritimus TaxID=2904244 RepID=UPI001F3D0EC4|nr:T9SS type A sorting domain-containing protein [Membranihabitans maritimus]